MRLQSGRRCRVLGVSAVIAVFCFVATAADARCTWPHRTAVRNYFQNNCNYGMGIMWTNLGDPNPKAEWVPARGKREVHMGAGVAEWFECKSVQPYGNLPWRDSTGRVKCKLTP